ncbi:N-acetyltransferase family protein [Actinomadura madurae]|uniref:GNAT family N-acetyltransferase n=1 Tax=Actinomadura madurae TaxID=1993 RepID=UPI00399C2612
MLEDMLSPASPHFCFVADADGGPVGFITGMVGPIGLFENRAGRIEDLFVLPAHRRRGLATELVDAAVAELGRRGVVVYNVEVPHDWRAGLAFWRRRRHWKQDAVVFSRYD